MPGYLIAQINIKNNKPYEEYKLSDKDSTI